MMILVAFSSCCCYEFWLPFPPAAAEAFAAAAGLRPVVVFLVVHNLSSLTRSPLRSAGVGGYIYIYIFIYVARQIEILRYIQHRSKYIEHVTERNKEGKAREKRFNQTVAKWLNRSAIGWGTLYLGSRVLGAKC